MDPIVVLGVNLTCAVVALKEYRIPEKDCLMFLFAKALGYAIVVASTILKLPQILIILRKKSVQGLSMASFEIECVGYTLAVSYCLVKQIPFSACGELFFLLIQAYILVILIYIYSPVKQGNLLWFKLGIYCALAPVVVSGSLPMHVYEALYNGQTALFNLGRMPQMWTNYKNKSTGQLSFTSTFLSFLGCIARLFTSMQEKAPMSMVFGSMFGLCSHGTLVSQILLYSPPAFLTSSIKKLEGKKQD